MRVVAGSAKGRRLVTPAGRDTRPTSDRVREAIFNSLRSLDAVAGATVLDLFAGSGALGIEALSRGAAHCTFVDLDRAAIGAVRTNLAALGLADQGTVVQADVAGWLAGTRPAVDLVLIDPPYAFDEWADLLGLVVAEVVVVESDRPIELPGEFDAPRTKRYGGTVVTLGRRVSRPGQVQS